MPPLPEKYKGQTITAEGDWNPIVRAINAASVPGEGSLGAVAPGVGRYDEPGIERVPPGVVESFMAVILRGRPTQYALDRMVKPIHLPRRIVQVPPATEGGGPTTRVEPIPATELPDHEGTAKYWVQQVAVIGNLGAGGFLPAWGTGAICFRKRWVRGRIVAATNLAELTLPHKHLITRPRITPTTTFIYSDRSPDEPGFVSPPSSAGCVTAITSGQLVMVHKIRDARATFRGPVGGSPTVTEVPVNGEHFVFTLGLPQVRTARLFPFRPGQEWIDAEQDPDAPPVSRTEISSAFALATDVVVGYYGSEPQAPDGYSAWVEAGRPLDDPLVPMPVGTVDYEQTISVLLPPCGTIPEGQDADEPPPPDSEEPPPVETPTPPPVETQSGGP